MSDLVGNHIVGFPTRRLNFKGTSGVTKIIIDFFYFQFLRYHTWGYIVCLGLIYKYELMVMLAVIYILL